MMRMDLAMEEICYRRMLNSWESMLQKSYNYFASLAHLKLIILSS